MVVLMDTSMVVMSVIMMACQKEKMMVEMLVNLMAVRMVDSRELKMVALKVVWMESDTVVS